MQLDHVFSDYIIIYYYIGRNKIVLHVNGTGSGSDFVDPQADLLFTCMITPCFGLWNQNVFYDVNPFSPTDQKPISVQTSVQPVTSRLIRIYTICQSDFGFRLTPLFASVDKSKFKNGRVHFRSSGTKELSYHTNRIQKVKGCVF